METIYTPILLIGFNRADDIQQSFDAIKTVKPQKLYIAIDGPREHKKDEDKRVAEVIDVVKNVDWDCDVHYRFSDKNMGCKGNLTSAISWVFETEDRVIIVEDDIVAPYSFFLFEQQMLEKYKDDNSVGSVTGNNYSPIDNAVDDYHFSYNAGHIWGWGTWKRVWEKFDVNLPSLGSDLLHGLPVVKNQCNSLMEYYYNYTIFLDLFLAKKNRQDNYWAIQFAYFRKRNNLLSIVPRVNLASNVGKTSSRVNSSSTTNKNYYPSNAQFEVKKHPLSVCVNREYDRNHFMRHLHRYSLKGDIRIVCGILYRLFLIPFKK